MAELLETSATATCLDVTSKFLNILMKYEHAIRFRTLLVAGILRRSFSYIQYTYVIYQTVGLILKSTISRVAVAAQNAGKGEICGKSLAASSGLNNYKTSTRALSS